MFTTDAGPGVHFSSAPFVPCTPDEATHAAGRTVPVIARRTVPAPCPLAVDAATEPIAKVPIVTTWQRVLEHPHEEAGPA